MQGGLRTALTLVALRTNDLRTAQTTGSGSYTFVNLAIGEYKLTVTRSGYATKVYDSVLVEASQTTTLKADLSVGSTADTVRVESEASPVIETSSNQIGTVVDMKQIEDLPLNGRDLTAFSALVPGYNGTYNGLPSNDQGSNIDGVIGNSSRMKFTGNTEPAVSPRLEDIEQMTVQTDQLDLNSGFGQSSTQVNFVSRRGGNQFHGRAYEDFRNSGLNANSWQNDVNKLRKNKLILNDFGGSVGGPILHDKAFFFGTFAMRKVPGSFTATNDVFTTAAQDGNFTYTGTDGTTRTVNLLQLAAQVNSSLPSTVNAEIAAQFSAINAAAASGSVTPTSNANFNQLAWIQGSATTYYYPAARVDLNLSQKARMYLAWLMTKQSQPANTAGDFPGSGFASQIAGNQTKNYTSSYGFDYIFTPQLINQFKAGFLYNATFYADNAAPLYTTQPSVAWNYPGASGQMSGQQYNLPVSTYYPIFNLSDSMTWQRGRHTLQYGVSWYREQDHYWNPPAGLNNYSLRLAAGDPALNAFTNSGSNATLPDASSANLTEAQQLYAILTGRISSVTGESPYSLKTNEYNTPGQTGEYPLDEVSTAFGLFAEDSWKVTQNLTLNYGLRWDFTGAQHDLTGLYHSASPAAIYGPSGVGDLFNPGSLKGDMNPSLTASTNPYNPWKVTSQPAFGFAWNPKPSDGACFADFNKSKNVFCGGRGTGERYYCKPNVFAPMPCWLFQNNGDGTFTDVSRESGIAGTPQKAWGAVATDVNNDGLPDLFVASDTSPNALFLNRGKGVFEEGGLLAGVAYNPFGVARSGMGVDATDYNQDGSMDLFVANVDHEMYSLYRNGNNGAFEDVAAQGAIGSTTRMMSGWGLKFFDYDNDGDIDLLIANGYPDLTVEAHHPELQYQEASLLFKGSGESWTNLSPQAGPAFARRNAGRGLALGDFDNDGAVDALISVNNGPPVLLKNQPAPHHHWLGVKLVGTVSNIDAVGAQITYQSGDLKRTITKVGGGSYLSSHDPRMVLGLGPRTKIDWLEVRWPKPGVASKKITGLLIDRYITVMEGKEGWS